MNAIQIFKKQDRFIAQLRNNSFSLGNQCLFQAFGETPKDALKNLLCYDEKIIRLLNENEELTNANISTLS